MRRRSRGIHVMAMPLKQRFQRHQDRPLIVDDQDAMVFRFHHLALLVLRTCSGVQLLKLREYHEVPTMLGLPPRHRECYR